MALSLDRPKPAACPEARGAGGPKPDGRAADGWAADRRAAGNPGADDGAPGDRDTGGPGEGDPGKGDRGTDGPAADNRAPGDLYRGDRDRGDQDTGDRGYEGFIRAHTMLGRAALVPEIALHLATEITPIWQATEDWLASHNIEPPFWSFAWPGGQALARHILDHPAAVAGRRVLDFAAGGGIAGIACALAGAASVAAAEIDPLAAAAIRVNAAANRVAVSATPGDVVGEPCRWDLILCGDVCYEAPMTAHILPWLRAMARAAEVWIADPGRAYLPREGLEPFARCLVPTTLELEDRTERTVVLYRLRADPRNGAA